MTRYSYLIPHLFDTVCKQLHHHATISFSLWYPFLLEHRHKTPQFWPYPWDNWYIWLVPVSESFQCVHSQGYCPQPTLAAVWSAVQCHVWCLVVATPADGIGDRNNRCILWRMCNFHHISISLPSSAIWGFKCSCERSLVTLWCGFSKVTATVRQM